jgi:FkbM family methyltransferase
LNRRLIRRIAKPEYFLRPGQILRRLARGQFAAIPPAAIVDLPWGFPLEVAPSETIGGGIWRIGVHEMVVSEVLWRLIDPGESVADVGANSGYFTSLMASRTGTRGVVWAFEPHPEMRQRLTRNIGLWRRLITDGQIALLPFGLSDVNGHAELCLPPSFEINTGTAYIRSSPVPLPEPLPESAAIRIETRRLDALFAPGDAPVVIKIDVEGHEPQVLAGAGDLLSRGGVRDIVFEEHRAYPASSMRLLEQRGYSLYSLKRGILRPLLESPDVAREERAWEAPNYLATLDPDRVHVRMRKAGWTCLSGTERRVQCES